MVGIDIDVGDLRPLAPALQEAGDGEGRVVEDAEAGGGGAVGVMPAARGIESDRALPVPARSAATIDPPVTRAAVPNMPVTMGLSPVPNPKREGVGMGRPSLVARTAAMYSGEWIRESAASSAAVGVTKATLSPSNR